MSGDGSPGVFAVVTGGGTAGHVLPALAIADALVARGHPRAGIHYVGTQRGVERSLLPPTGYPFTLLDVVGLQRSLSRRNLMVVPKAVGAVRAASRLMAELRPKVVVNVGGYASFPMSFVAGRHGVPLVVVSYDRRPGLVSRLMGRRAAVCAVAFEGSPLPHTVLTGAPIRAELVTLDRAARREPARRELGLPQHRFVVAVMCGSLGAQPVNEVVGELVERWSTRTDMAIFHVVGDRFVDQAKPALDGSQGIMYAVKGYEARMADLYAAADLLVTRGGAGTISELAAVGAPAVIVPWPGAAENHQLDNARTLSDHGAAVTIEQTELTVDRLADEIDRLQRDTAALATMAAAAYAQGARHRDGSLVDVIERVAR